VAAGEEELEALVRKAVRFHLVLRRFRDLEQARLLDQDPVTADPVDRPAPRRRDQPVPRVGGDAASRPLIGGDREGFLTGFLGEVEVAEEAEQRSEDAPPLLLVDALQNR
jgi:hypothetical protein